MYGPDSKCKHFHVGNKMFEVSATSETHIGTTIDEILDPVRKLDEITVFLCGFLTHMVIQTLFDEGSDRHRNYDGT